MSINKGRSTHALPGSSHSTSTTLASTAMGPTEMSSPPPPDRMAGVEAMATIANGASVASSVGQLPGLPKFGSARTLATSSSRASPAAKTNGRVRRSSRRSGIDGLPEERGDERLAGQVGTGQLGRDAALPEDDHAVHELDVLVDLGREHRDGHAVGGEVEQQPVQVALGVDVHAARRVV